MLKIRIIKADTEILVNKILHLEKIEDMIWVCSKTRIKVIDTWDELDGLDIFCQKWKIREFKRFHLFAEVDKELHDIYEIRYIP